MTRYSATQHRSDSVFPELRDTREVCVNSAALCIAKQYAIDRLQRHKARLEQYYTRYARRVYKRKRASVRILHDEAITRVRNARLAALAPNVLGETDGPIAIGNSITMTFDLLVSTLVHEALHNYVQVGGKHMGCEREHCCMQQLGEA